MSNVYDKKEKNNELYMQHNQMIIDILKECDYMIKNRHYMNDVAIRQHAERIKDIAKYYIKEPEWIELKENKTMSDEEKKAINSIKRKFECEQTRDNYKILIGLYKNVEIEILLNLIEKQSKEIEELKKENEEIRDWKYVIDTVEDLNRLKDLDFIKINGKKFINEDNIKAKIEELKDGTYDAKIILKQLLKEE